MRASSLAVIVGTIIASTTLAPPVMAQCVYVACGGTQLPPPPPPPHYQPQQVVPPAYQEEWRERSSQSSSATERRVQTRTTVKRRSSATSSTARSAYRAGYAAGLSARKTHVKSRKASARRAIVSRSPDSLRTSHTTSHAGGTPIRFVDTVKDRAATYRPPVHGQTVSLGSSSSSYSSSYSAQSSSSNYSGSSQTGAPIRWMGPTTIVRQGGQVCGWGTRIVTNQQGYAQQSAVWVCQCPQGWRPPGY